MMWLKCRLYLLICQLLLYAVAIVFQLYNVGQLTYSHCAYADFDVLHVHHNLFITLFLGFKPISVLAIQSVLYREYYRKRSLR